MPTSSFTSITLRWLAVGAKKKGGGTSAFKRTVNKAPHVLDEDHVEAHAYLCTRAVVMGMVAVVW